MIGEIVEIDDVLYITLLEPFTVHDREELKRQPDIFPVPKVFVVDFNGVRTVDMVGLSTLVKLSARLRDSGGRHLGVRRMNPDILDLFRSTRMDKIIMIMED